MFPNLYDAQYMSGRHHSNTAKVYAGFQEDTLIPGMSVKKISYGVQKWQPEISSDTAVIQLYSDSAGKELKTNEGKVSAHYTINVVHRNSTELFDLR